MSKNNNNDTVNIKILDKDYNINCPDSERESLMASSRLLNEKINEVRSGGKVVGGERIAIMAALNLAHDLLEQKTVMSDTEEAEIQRRLQKISGKIETALNESQQIELT